MATHEDIFLLKLLLEEGLVSYKDIHTPLCAFCKQEMQEKNIALWQVIEQSRLVAPEALQKTLEKTRKTIEEIRPVKIKVISAKDCHRHDILGKSSLGSVYRADHPEIGACAIKKFEGIIGKNKKFLRQFLNQLKKGLEVRHLNFAAIYAINAYEGLVIRELVAGKSLEDRLSQGVILPDQAAQIIFQAARGLQAAHKQQLLHKNLKPSNIIISDDGLVKVVDGCLPPTVPHYLSPEQCQKKKSDARSDIYALGIVFYQILTGMVPFSGHNAREIMAKHVEHPHRPLHKINEDIPDAVCAVVDKMVAKAPENRYQNLDELLVALEQIVDIRSLPDYLPARPVELRAIPADLQMPDESVDDQGEQSEDSMMHTAMMVTVAPSEAVEDKEKIDAIAVAGQSIMEAQPAEENDIVDSQIEAQPAEEDEEMLTLAEDDEMAAEAIIEESTMEAEAVDMDDSEMEAQPVDEDDEVAVAQAEAGLSDDDENEIEEAQLAEEDPMTSNAAEFAGIEERVSEAALEAVAVDDKLQTTEWEDTMEAVAVDDNETGDMPSLPEENDFKSAFDGKSSTSSKRLFSVPDTTNIPISKRPVPRQKAAANDTESMTNQEWGPGQNDDEEADAAGPSLKDRLKSSENKLKPYFERLKEKEQD